jgi:5'-nucleotidase
VPTSTAKRLRRLRRGPLLVVLLAILSLLIPVSALAAKPSDTFDLQILDVSDWHGQLDPLTVGTTNVGGAAVLSTYFQRDRAGHTGPSLTLTAGDDVGATPPLSGFFQDTPAILAERLMGIQIGTFGNHNFDAGLGRLQSQIDLARDKKGAFGTPFNYVASNLSNRDTNLKHVKDYQIFTYNGVQFAVIGIVNEEAPTLVFPGSFGTMTVTDSAAAAMTAKAAAAAAGADVFVAITHKGVTGFTGPDPHGEVIDFANAVSGFDLIYGDHTDVQYSGTINGQLVVENRSKGVTYSRTLLTIDRLAAQVTGASNSFVSPVAASVTPDPAVVAMLAPYRTQLSALLDGTIGVATATYVRGGNIERRQEVPLGDLIADGLVWRYGTQLGYMNGGGIRAPLPSAYAPADLTLRRAAPPYVVGPPFDLVTGDVYTVLPFGNIVLTRTVTGIQLWQMLENGVSKIDSSGNGAQGRFPQISGFKFTFHYLNPSGCSGSEVPPITWSCVPSRVTSVEFSGGTPIPYDGTTYSVATINFINAGGDSYTMLNDGQGVTREVDADVMLPYMAAVGPTFDPTVYPLDRITKLP